MSKKKQKKTFALFKAAKGEGVFFLFGLPVSRRGLYFLKKNFKFSERFGISLKVWGGRDKGTKKTVLVS